MTDLTKKALSKPPKLPKKRGKAKEISIIDKFKDISKDDQKELMSEIKSIERIIYYKQLQSYMSRVCDTTEVLTIQELSSVKKLVEALDETLDSENDSKIMIDYEATK